MTPNPKDPAGPLVRPRGIPKRRKKSGCGLCSFGWVAVAAQLGAIVLTATAMAAALTPTVSANRRRQAVRRRG